jgi:hypothetical protein
MEPSAQPGQVLSYVDNASTHIREYSFEIGNIYSTLDSQATQCCFSLPWPAAVITYRLWKAAPYIAAQILLPSSIYIIGVIGIIAYRIIVTPKNEKPDLTSILNGIGFSQIVSGTRSFAIGCSFSNRIQLISGLFWIIIGGACLFYSGIVQRICTPPQPQDIQQNPQR